MRTLPFLLLAALACASGASAQEHVREKLSFDVDGRTRIYVLEAPAKPDAHLPLVIALHPGVSSGASFEAASRLAWARGAGKFAFAFPDGVSKTWNAGRCCGKAKEENVDDVKFMSALIDELSKHPGIDTSRVFLTGFSNGAKMTYRLACEIGDRITAIAPYGSSMDLGDGVECKPAKPIPVLHLHGLLDEVAPFEGGQSSLRRVGIQPSARETVMFWAKANGCTAEPKPATLLPGADCVSFEGCSAETSLCTISDLAHHWPGFKAGPLLRRTLGPDRPDMDASSAILEFFSRHSR